MVAVTNVCALFVLFLAGTNSSQVSQGFSYDPKVGENLFWLSSAAYCTNVTSLVQWNCEPCEKFGSVVISGTFSNPLTQNFGFVGYTTSPLPGLVGPSSGPNERYVLVSFRGTVPNMLMNWIEDLYYAKTVPFPSSNHDMHVHSGFLEAYQATQSDMMMKIKEAVVASNSTYIIVTGHSLGAAIATIAAMDLKLNVYPDFHLALYTQGSPRVGDKAFVAKFVSLIDASFRLVHNNDVVPHVPPMKLGFQHVPFEVFFDERFDAFTFCNSTLSGEDSKCSDSLPLPINIWDHTHYYNTPVGGFCDCGVGKCPKDPACNTCKQYKDCATCSSADWCGWCSTSNTCVQTGPFGEKTRPCNSSETCKGCVHASQKDCPALGTTCANYTTCSGCAVQPWCAWCTNTATCIPTGSFSDKSRPCSGASCAGCVRAKPDQCPEDGLRCSDFNNCSGCATQPGCGWCTDTLKCIPTGSFGDKSRPCGGASCGGCVKSKPDQCPQDGLWCSDFKTCSGCSPQPGCGWCTKSRTCLATGAFGDKCRLCNPKESCPGCMRCHETQCPSGGTNCADHATCTDCSAQPWCGWCTSSRSCMDTGAFEDKTRLCNKGESCPGCMHSQTKDCPAGGRNCEDFAGAACNAQPWCGLCSTKGCFSTGAFGDKCRICDTKLEKCDGANATMSC